MLSPARITERDNAIEDLYHMMYYEEHKDFFQRIDDELTEEEFMDELKDHTLYRLILIQNKENVEEDIEGLYQAYKDRYGEYLRCEVCTGSYPEDRIIGCCNKQGCKIEILCRDCAEFDEELEEYVCGDC